MKKIGLLFLLMSFSLLVFCQAQEIEQLKLDLEKLVQMKTMLSNMYNGYTTLSNVYNQITSLAKDNFDLHKNYLDQLLQVAEPVRNNPLIQAILELQATISTEGNTAYMSYVKSGLFRTNELQAFKNRLDQTKAAVSKQLNHLQLVLTPGSLRMSDQERMGAIDRIDKDVGDLLVSIRAIVKEQNDIAAARAQQKKDNNAIKAWYGFKQ